MLIQPLLESQLTHTSVPYNYIAFIMLSNKRGPYESLSLNFEHGLHPKVFGNLLMHDLLQMNGRGRENEFRRHKPREKYTALQPKLNARLKSSWDRRTSFGFIGGISQSMHGLLRYSCQVSSRIK